ncbi:cora-domain-containing protein [Ophiobolus disseminans]|uniref:Cora-domain-containing protein n=1 Tax=Ophiobolus disseminans TaxID=1469910 RepID=A0A6A6ZNY8_9PLEO|nr:cora-domain-containing protein [Ophiobolus disseminans]
MASSPHGRLGPESSRAAAASMNQYSATYAEAAGAGPSSSAPAKKKKHRGGKKKRNRRQSFAAPADIGTGDMNDERPSLANMGGNGHSRGSNSFYRNGNLSSTSLESEALLDHRDQPTIRTRRPSAPMNSMYQPRASLPFVSSPHRLNAASSSTAYGRSRLSHTAEATTYSDDNEDDDANDRTPLMGTSQREIRSATSYGGASGSSGRNHRRSSVSSGMHKPDLFTQHHHSQTNLQDYDVNNPPSVPTSPVIKANNGLHDVMLTEDLEHSRSRSRSRDALIDIVEHSEQGSPRTPGEFRRRMTTTALEDVCFPHETMSELGHEDYLNPPTTGEPTSRRRRRRWPDLEILDTWAHEEKEQRSIEGMRMRKVSEPLMVEGRLRPRQRVWHREASDAPFRFTYFNETFDNTIHSQIISELVQPGQTFRNLFVPDPVVLEDSSDEDTDDEDLSRLHVNDSASRATTRSPSKTGSGEHTRSTTPKPSGTPKPEEDKPKRYGPRPAWWLDVMSPTETEMKVISKTFGIHPLTSEDILMQEQREKVELFKHYYFINYRTFEQDENSEDYLEPVNLYVVVFREGVISFHFSMTPHPANVRRRIRQLSDYLVLSPDWISYAIIDDITDAYAPMIQRIEQEVDDIDEAILRLHSDEEEQETEKPKLLSYNNSHHEKSADGNKEQQESGRDMLRRVGECRKKVMSLYRLLGNKADVIKGFAKRCNEQWDIAPRNEIGMYLGDIQDHIVTMTANLGHYENLLSRAHSNYLAQINIRMNERQEKTSDILGKLTVLGTIVLPMNVVTGIWGMNCIVPGQDVENLNWFFAITGGLLAFGLGCFLVAKKFYGIV